MKRWTLKVAIAALVMLACTLSAWAADYVDVVYLKSGSVVRGMIVEQVPNESVKIKTADGSLFVFKMSEIEKITKEEVAASNTGGAAHSGTGEPARPMAAMNFIGNPMGFLQAGPIVELEFQIKPGLYVIAHARIHGLGLLSQLLSDPDFPAFYSFAVGPAVRYFFLSKDTPHAPFLGFLTEFGFNPYSGDAGYSTAYAGSSIYLTFAANGGYRWRFGSFILETGAYAGVSPTLSSQWHYLSSPSVTHAGGTPITFFGMLELSIGWEF